MARYSPNKQQLDEIGEKLDRIVELLERLVAQQAPVWPALPPSVPQPYDPFGTGNPPWDPYRVWCEASPGIVSIRSIEGNAQTIVGDVADNVSTSITTTPSDGALWFIAPRYDGPHRNGFAQVVH